MLRGKIILLRLKNLENCRAEYYRECVVKSIKKGIFKNCKLIFIQGLKNQTLSYEYGIEIIREALIKLCSGSSFELRLREAFYEIGEIVTDDVGLNYFKDILDLVEEFNKERQYFVNKTGDESGEKLETMQNIADKLVRLAIDICIANTRLISKDEIPDL